MIDRLIEFFSSSGFMPHIHCYLANPALVWTMFITDLLIGLAYFGMSLTLWALIRKIKIPFGAIVLCFGLFIGACGLTHFMEVWTLWNPTYWLSASIKSVTAIASVGTGIYLFKLKQPIIAVTDAIKLSERRRLDLEALTKSLEERVNERTHELELANTQLRLITDAVPALISFIDEDLRYRFVNSTYEEWFGTPAAKMIGKSMQEVMGEAALNLLRPDIEKVLSGKKVHFERKVPYKDAGTRWVEGSYIPQIDANSRVVGFYVLIQDITERKDAEAALKASEQRFRTVTDNAASCLFVLDQQGYPTFMNPSASRVTGFESLDEIKDKPLHESIHLKKPDGSAYPIELCATHRIGLGLKPIQNQDETYCRKDGTLFPVAFSLAPLERDGQNIGAVLEFRDITEQKRTEDALRHAILSRDEFLSIASHELKTPVTTMKLQAQMRQRKLAKGDSREFDFQKLTQLFDNDARQIDRLTSLIDDMFDISRIQTGKLTLQMEDLDLCEVVRDTVNRYRPQFEESSARIRLRACDPALGQWDRFRMEQVVANLLMNALKYGAGSPVDVSVEVDEKVARLTVMDHGIGIAPENLERIFLRFERAISANQISGLGLGLYIVRQIVEMHHGQITVQSELGKGSCFIVTLPILRAGQS